MTFTESARLPALWAACGSFLPGASRRARGMLWGALAALVLAGCNARSDLARVNGKVTLDGAPLPDAFVEFVPKGPGSTSYGKTDTKGEYDMAFSLTAQGASLGESVVRITTRDIYRDEEGRDRWYPEKVPARYNTDSELVVTVEPGGNEFDFALESAGAQPASGKTAQ